MPVYTRITHSRQCCNFYLLLNLQTLITKVVFKFLRYLADSFQDADGNQGSEAANSGKDGSQQSEQCCPRDAEQHEQLATDLLCYHATNDLRRRIAVEERSENDALGLCIPVEASVRLMRSTATTRFYIQDKPFPTHKGLKR